MRIGLLIAVAVIFLALAVGVFWTSAPDKNAGADRLQISATIAPLADWAREVGGDDVRVVLLVDGYKDPHHFEPSVADAVRVSASKILLAAGLGLDPWAERLVANAGKGDALKYIDCGDWITPRKLSVREIEIHPGAAKPDDAPAQSPSKTIKDVHAAIVKSHGHQHNGDEDPHYWHDPHRAAEIVKHLADEFIKLDAPHKDAYLKRRDACLEKLSALDAAIESAAKKIPAGTQVVTFHDAYGYLFERLGVKVAAVVQASPGVEPTLRDCAEALRVMREIHQKAVFKEPASSDKVIELIARDLNIQRMAVLDPIDNGESPVGKNYFERMTHNIKTLEDVLGAPAK